MGREASPLGSQVLGLELELGPWVSFLRGQWPPLRPQLLAPAQTARGWRWAAGSATGSPLTALSPSSHPLLLPAPSDAAAGERAVPGGGRGRGAGGQLSRLGGASALPPPRRASAPRTPHFAASEGAVAAGTSGTWAEPDRIPRGNGRSCPFLPPLSQGSRWPGLLSCRRTRRTTPSVSAVSVNGALSGWLERAQLAV